MYNNKKGKMFALIISSLAFSIYHAGGIDPILMLQAFLIGIVLGYLYIITEALDKKTPRHASELHLHFIFIFKKFLYF